MAADECAVSGEEEAAVVAARPDEEEPVEVEPLALGLCCDWLDEVVELAEDFDVVLVRGSMYC